ncbi:MAG: thymidylate synthase [Candidatus Aenigmatarchaeota archaeon]
MNDWPIIEGDYTPYNKNASSAVVFVGNNNWKIKRFQEKVAISGKLMTPQGIERLVLNVITNPSIRDLILIGKDISPFFSKNALVSFYENGIDKENNIVDTKAKICKLSNMKEKFTEYFREQIKNIFEVKDRDELKEFLSEYTKKEKFPRKLDISEEELSIKPSVPEMPFSKSGYFVEAENIEKSWKEVLRTIWNSGKEIKSQEGKTKEILNMVVHIREPLQKEIEGYPLGPEELENYAESLVHPKLGHNAEYTYGLRLRVREDRIVDQIEQVIKKLKDNPSTRRAVAVLWVPEVDGKKDSGQPCIISIDFKIRDGKLHLSAVMRSNDMYGAVPSNWYGLAKLNEFVAKKVGVRPGPITTLSHSAHIYFTDYPSIENLIEDDETNDYLEDELGYFLIEIDREENEIKVKFFDPEGKMCKKYVGKNSTFLRKKILKDGLISLKEHAAYLGEQLTKAECALKYDLKFEQDKA